MGLTHILNRYRGSGLFLPAHGRGAALPRELKVLLRKRAGIWDLPELPELGGPLEPFGAIAQSQKNSASAMGVSRCWYGVNGATGLLHAALLGIAAPGKAVLVPRNVHISIINACVIGELIPIIFDLPFMPDRGHVAPPDENWLKDILDSISQDGVDLAAAVLVHPTYQGYANDLTPLIKQLHEKDLVVIVDEAHGAYFASEIDEDLPKSSLKAGADLVVHSLHKSATGLGQTAVLWLQGERVDPVSLERSLSCLQTSSPSSLLLASCEAALLEWRKLDGRRRLSARINEARNIADQLKTFGVPLLENQDPLRLILYTASQGINGLKADAWFISRGFIPELPEPGSLTFCLGFKKHLGLSRLLKKNWDGLLSSYKEIEPLLPFSPPPMPLVNIPAVACSSAWRASWESVPLLEAAGRVSTDFICPYPPGIPMLFPGEILDEKRISWLVEQKSQWLGQIPSEIKVVS